MQKLFTLTILVAIGYFLPVSAQTSPYLDHSFGVDGRTTYKFKMLNPASCTTYLSAIAMLQDGKILMAGYGFDANQKAAGLVRFTQDGALDTTFANKGEWISNDPNLFNVQDMLVQPDHKILLGCSGTNAFKLVRLNPDGTYDTSFGLGGRVNFIGANIPVPHYLRKLALFPDGSILMTGWYLTADHKEYPVAKFKSNGITDVTFIQSGGFNLLPTDIDTNGKSLTMGHIALLSDSSFVLSGVCLVTGADEEVFLLHYNKNGVRDTIFGEQGVATIKKTYRTTGLMALPDDSFFLLSKTPTGVTPGHVLLYKYLKNGAIDSSFADHGAAVFQYSTPNIPGNDANGGLLQDDGKVLIFGGGSNSSGYLGRYNADGSRDSSFGEFGVIKPETNSEQYGLGAFQSDGKLVVSTGLQDQAGNPVGSILRYIPTLSVGVIESEAPLSSALIYPNPLRQSCSLKYELLQASPVNIELLDMQGQLLHTLLQETRPAGLSEETLNFPEALPSGHYLLRITTNKGNTAIKVIVD